VSTYRYVIVDVFTDTPLAGNQLAVFTDGRGLDSETMQALALEIGFSETVFVLPAERDGDVRIRVFTPRVELPLQRGAIRLEIGLGVVPVELVREESGAIAFGRMTLPVPSIEAWPDPVALLGALGVSGSSLPVERYDNGVQHTFVALESAEQVAELQPDLERLAALDVNANCFARSGGRWKTRMFAPSMGVPEDPATGSAAGPLACHLCRHGLVPWGTEIEVEQGAEIGRPSTLFARAEGHGGAIERVEVGGSAVIVARGEFRLTGP
jgi:trans-2,3-dihydro-3-hydroxyanthranilate isomerase